MPLDQWRKQIDVILTGVFVFTKYAAQSMVGRKVRGSIINIVSTAGHEGEPDSIAYSTAKAICSTSPVRQPWSLCVTASESTASRLPRPTRLNRPSARGAGAARLQECSV